MDVRKSPRRRPPKLRGPLSPFRLIARFEKICLKKPAPNQLYPVATDALNPGLYVLLDFNFQLKNNTLPSS
jgi:hypothetical protein